VHNELLRRDTRQYGCHGSATMRIRRPAYAGPAVGGACFGGDAVRMAHRPIEESRNQLTYPSSRRG